MTSNITIKDDPTTKTLTLVIDYSKEGKRSASGKSLVLASTEGNQKVNSTGLTLGLNLYTK
jgi:hypothetical protein